MSEIKLLLSVAREADYWDFAVRIGEDIDADEQTPEIEARYFNTIAHFLAPTPEHPHWQIGGQELSSKHPDETEIAGDVLTAQVIDVVPSILEEVWVLTATRRTAEYLLEVAPELEPGDADEAARMRQEGVRLRSEWEQAEAHSRRWRERSEGHYGYILLYELRDDTPIVYERIEYERRPALLMGHQDSPSDVILIPPDAEHAWRRSSPGHADEYGRRISVREALDYAGDDHSEWVIEQTALALGETLTAIRAVQDRALSGREPDALAELTRLSDHARRSRRVSKHRWRNFASASARIRHHRPELKRSPYKQEVPGSSPGPPINKNPADRHLSGWRLLVASALRGRYGRDLEAAAILGGSSFSGDIGRSSPTIARNQ